MSLSGLKDVDREVLKHVDDKELLKFCTVDRKTWNEVCDDAFLRRRLASKYPGIEEYKREDESWKKFFLNVIYYIFKMKEKYEFEYTEGDFKKQYFILKEASNYDDIDNLLTEAAKQGELSLVKFALEKGANVHAYADGALRNASEKGHLEVVKYLIENGADIHTINDYPLRQASENGHLETVKYLLQQGANIHAVYDSALYFATLNNHYHVVKYLIEHGADMHAKNDRVIKLAIKYKRFEILNYLKSNI